MLVLAGELHILNKGLNTVLLLRLLRTIKFIVHVQQSLFLEPLTLGCKRWADFRDPCNLYTNVHPWRTYVVKYSTPTSVCREFLEEFNVIFYKKILEHSTSSDH